MIGGPRFYERREIRDALAYLRASCNRRRSGVRADHQRAEAGLGDTTVQQLHDYARATNLPLMQAARDMSETEEVKAKQRSTLRDLLRHSTAGRCGSNQPHFEVAETILDECGYTEMWQDDKSADAPGRLENLKELVRSMEEFETITGFLEHVSLVMERDAGEAQDAGRS